MVWQFTTYTFLTLASAVVSSALALTSWYRRPAPGSASFCLLMATALRLQVEAQRADGWSILFEESLGPERLPPAIETTLFSIAQESLTNVRKHAQTLRVRLILERRESKIRLEVQDWGCGFETDILLREFCPGEHVGIRAMQERVELVGGHFLVSSQPGVGTLLVAEVPAMTYDEANRDAELPSILSDERSIEYEQ